MFKSEKKIGIPRSCAILVCHKSINISLSILLAGVQNQRELRVPIGEDTRELQGSGGKPQDHQEEWYHTFGVYQRAILRPGNGPTKP